MNYEELEDDSNPAEMLKTTIERIKLEMKKKWMEGAKDETFAEKNLIRIVDNAIVNISNIHLRIEKLQETLGLLIGSGHGRDHQPYSR